MWAPGYFPFLVLMLALIPQPGVSQGANNWKHCQDCKKLLTDANVTDRFYANLIKNATYESCPNNIARFKLPRGIFCGVRGESWVEKVIGCINQGREPCLKPSENQQDPLKGSNEKPPSTPNEKPPSTSQETTTSTSKVAPSPRESIQTWEGGTQKSSESANKNLGTTQKTLEITIGPTTAAPGSDMNNGLLQGNKSPATEKEDEKSKTKHMTIAIISLIIIVLVMTTIGMYFVCRKKKITECRTTYNSDGNIVYEQALMKEQEEQEPVGDV